MSRPSRPCSQPSIRRILNERTAGGPSANSAYQPWVRASKAIRSTRTRRQDRGDRANGTEYLWGPRSIIPAARLCQHGLSTSPHPAKKWTRKPSWKCALPPLRINGPVVLTQSNWEAFGEKRRCCGTVVTPGVGSYFGVRSSPLRRLTVVRRAASEWDAERQTAR